VRENGPAVKAGLSTGRKETNRRHYFLPSLIG
jgi:hypothetical protein